MVKSSFIIRGDSACMQVTRSAGMNKGYRSFLSAMAVAGALLQSPAAFSAEDFAAMNAVPEPGIRVVLNQARIVKLSQPAATVIIGNPEIADATVRDSRTLVLTGRGFGQTNLVILDAGGNPILDERIAVSRENGAALRIYRQANIETLSCEPYCEKAYLSEAEIQSIRAIAEANNSGNN
jgi:Flp pilus assembly secretin CpaC